VAFYSLVDAVLENYTFSDAKGGRSRVPRMDTRGGRWRDLVCTWYGLLLSNRLRECSWPCTLSTNKCRHSEQTSQIIIESDRRYLRPADRLLWQELVARSRLLKMRLVLFLLEIVHMGSDCGSNANMRRDEHCSRCCTDIANRPDISNPAQQQTGFTFVGAASNIYWDSTEIGRVGYFEIAFG
jgi:hypothetical protein